MTLNWDRPKELFIISQFETFKHEVHFFFFIINIINREDKDTGQNSFSRGLKKSPFLEGGQIHTHYYHYTLPFISSHFRLVFISYFILYC
jgi:hypothetical protein